MADRHRPWTKQELRRRIADLERLIPIYKLATDAELASVAETYPGRTKHELYLRWAELHAFAKRREEQARRTGDVSAAELWKVAQEALEDRQEVVRLPSLDRTVRITPASWARIMIVEDCDWWLLRLTAARMVFKNDADAGKRIEELDETLTRIREEASRVRALLFGQIVAPSPAPAEEPVEWADRITPAEEAALLAAWHNVNTDVLKRLTAPASKRDGSKLPPTWSIVFQSVAWQNKEYPATVIHDWSLVAVCALNTIQATKIAELEKDSKRKAH